MSKMRLDIDGFQAELSAFCRLARGLDPVRTQLGGTEEAQKHLDEAQRFLWAARRHLLRATASIIEAAEPDGPPPANSIGPDLELEVEEESEIG